MKDFGKLRNLWLQKLALWENVAFMHGSKIVQYFFNFPKNKLDFISFSVHIYASVWSIFSKCLPKKDTLYSDHAARPRDLQIFLITSPFIFLFTNTVFWNKKVLCAFMNLKKKKIRCQTDPQQRRAICDNYWATTLQFYFAN